MRNLLLSIGLLLSPAAFAANYDPDLKWRTLETDHFTITFHDGEEQLAREMAVDAEVAWAKLTTEIRHESRRKVEIVLVDYTDDANGYASIVPVNAIVIFVTAPEASSSLGLYRDWNEAIITHELTHILHMDTVEGLPWVVRQVMGRIISPHQVSPGWIIEGYATFQETKHTVAGRGRAASVDMVKRAAVLDGKFPPLGNMDGYQSLPPAGNLRYLFGQDFIQYIADNSSPQAWTDYVHRYGRSIPYFLPAKKSFGKSFVALYRDWRAELHRRYTAQAAEITANGLTPYRVVSPEDNGCGQPSWSPDGKKLAFACSDPTSGTSIRVLEEGKPESEVLVKDKGASQLTWRADGRALIWSQSHSVKLYNVWDDVYLYDLDKDAIKTLTSGARAREPDFSPDGSQMVVVTNALQNNQLAVLTVDQRLTPLTSGTDHTQYGEPTYSPDGKWIAVSVWKDSHRDLWIYTADGRPFRRVTWDTAIDREPSWSADGRYLYFTSDRSGVPNIYAIERDTEHLWQVTNVLTGAFGAAAHPDGRALAVQIFTTAGAQVALVDVDPARWIDAGYLPRWAGVDGALHPNTEPPPPEVDLAGSPWATDSASDAVVGAPWAVAPTADAEVSPWLAAPTILAEAEGAEDPWGAAAATTVAPTAVVEPDPWATGGPAAVSDPWGVPVAAPTAAIDPWAPAAPDPDPWSTGAVATPVDDPWSAPIAADPWFGGGAPQSTASVGPWSGADPWSTAPSLPGGTPPAADPWSSPPSAASAASAPSAPTADATPDPWAAAEPTPAPSLPVAPAPVAPAPVAPLAADTAATLRPYNPVPTLLPPRFWLPSLYLTSTGESYGLFGAAATGGRDVLGFLGYSAYLSYRTDARFVGGGASVTINRWRPVFGLSFSSSVSPYGDVYRQTAEPEGGGAYVPGIETTLSRYWDHRLRGSASGYYPLNERSGVTAYYSVQSRSPLDPLPADAYIAALPTRGLFSSVGAGWSWSKGSSYALSISPERTRTLAASIELTPWWLGSTTFDDQNAPVAFNQLQLTGEWREYRTAPWLANHAFAWKLAAGATVGDRFAYGTYRLGGSFSENGITVVPSEWRMLRGYYPASDSGEWFWQASGEYRFPIWYVDRGVGTFPLFVKHVSGAVLVDAGNAFDDAAGAGLDQTLLGVGAELRLYTIWGYGNGSYLRGGYAFGLTQDGIPIGSPNGFYLGVGTSF